MSLPLKRKEALQDIYALPEPTRTQRINDWVDEYDSKWGGDVLLRASTKKGLKLPLGNGEWYNIPPSGRRTPRRLAHDLMNKFGPGTSFLGRDMRTGITQVQYATMHPDVRKVVDELNRIDSHTLDFMPDFIIHVPDADDNKDTDFVPTDFDYSDLATDVANDIPLEE